MQIPHIPVLPKEVNHLFEKLNEGVFLDCTLGYGGHSENLLKMHPNLHLIACDQDEEALKFSKERLREFDTRIKLYHSNFSQILEQIDLRNLRGILADIGVSSLHLDKDERGFSLRSNFLDMRMDKNQPLSAFDVINNYSKEKLANIFKIYGELKNGDFLAEKIIRARARKQIASAKELCEILGDTRLKNRKISQAILAFQALRIEVNKELEVLELFLQKLEKAHLKDCILAIICFHSLEDRIVKNYFKKWAKACICDERSLRCECGANHNLGAILNKKPLTPSQEEIKVNPRSSCAKMRAFYFK
ncbi:16S rRNA (cytosine(1402)-N(4))-methyltransferase RsmH [Campylobacter vulpis]|uniref:Ribosomal RNA small subunit methyltransferase H n=1 Tax=Campylobacter vulpis TaxID=1655500 RepID=A0A2G4R149_9BACT|nr:16S rRNA (cytosine(1402)-N(4))-methyltransferase RsmH [Campylobacter vulpis]MBS4330748.1 16S rRNA (cytosine(1402)-N(4))-methyltransferase RsmH [Campylobacter vulpis]MBS4438925.1 16S rRNA (cytosine(1402)-N(4))-methyltransferase RsmH [Campylobacter vulpis]PHY90292.1 16S rRNA methyltransferase [Campylobacter vulpis]